MTFKEELEIDSLYKGTLIIEGVYDEILDDDCEVEDFTYELLIITDKDTGFDLTQICQNTWINQEYFKFGVRNRKLVNVEQFIKEELITKISGIYIDRARKNNS